MNRASALLLPLALAGPLAACSSAGEYPSLARRPAERVTGTAQVPTAQPAPEPPSPAITARTAQLVEQARQAHQRFLARRSTAERLAAAAGGAALASESWADATVALSELEAARSEAMIALAELDQLYAGQRIETFAPESGNVETVAAARGQVMAWVEVEDQVLAALRGRLRT